MNRQILLFLLLFVCACSALRGQEVAQSIRGTVTDASSGEPLPFCTVSLKGDYKEGVLTDSVGQFVFSRIPVGRYDIEVSYLGYSPTLLKEVLVTSAKETVVEIAMHESSVALTEVVIRPEFSKSRPINPMALSSARMLSVEEAGRFAGGLDDPARLAGAFAGVATNIGDNGITVRCNAPKALQWKLEGIEIPNPNHFGEVGGFGGGGLTALSSQVLGNSDFLTGAFPAEYGNALSGVFDLRLRSGNNACNEHAVSVGTMGIDLSSEGPLRKGGRSSYLFNYRYSTLSFISGFLPDGAGAGMKYQDLSFKFDFPTKRFGNLSVWGLGLMDSNREKPKLCREEWEYEADRCSFKTSIGMLAIGVSHLYRFDAATYLKTSLAGTYNGIDSYRSWLSDHLTVHPDNIIRKNNGSLVFTSFLNRKLGRGSSNRTGLTITQQLYDLLLRDARQSGNDLSTVADEKGTTALLEAYTHFHLSLAQRWALSLGLHAQYLTLNGHYSVEPRLGVKHDLLRGRSITLSYGLHSRMEQLNYYFTRSEGDGNHMNKDLDFTRAHHVVLSYDWNISNHLHFRLEPYLQWLYKVPVVAGGSSSLINLKDDWFLTDKFVNVGHGLNYGVEWTLEKFMSHGYYGMFTGSLFGARYQGGDGIWRNTRYNRNYLLNFLWGKEWMMGRKHQKQLGLNFRLTYRGGDRYSPIRTDESRQAQKVVYDEARAFSQQLPPVFWGDFTVSYRINHRNVFHEIALKMLNATFHQEYLGHEYNFKTGQVDVYRDGISMPNFYYKVCF